LIPDSKLSAVEVQLPPYPCPPAQAERWSTPAHKSLECSLACDSVFWDQHVTQINITLPDASYEPAAMALLEGLYHVKPWSKLLADLPPEQQVQAAVLADMWQLTAACKAAVAVLEAVIYDTDSLAAVLETLLNLDAVPDCLSPVFEQFWQALLSKHSSLAAMPQWLALLLWRV
jgi:hypothetical protein